jgi:streptogramin lyase
MAVLPLSRASVFFDGIFSSPRLQHPEGVAVAPDGAVWCSSENAQILRISPDGSLRDDGTTDEEMWEPRRRPARDRPACLTGTSKRGS